MERTPPPPEQAEPFAGQGQVALAEAFRASGRLLGDHLALTELEVRRSLHDWGQAMAWVGVALATVSLGWLVMVGALVWRLGQDLPVWQVAAVVGLGHVVAGLWLLGRRRTLARASNGSASRARGQAGPTPHQAPEAYDA